MFEGNSGQRAAFVTLITDDSYLPGVVALSKSLRATATKYPLHILTTCAVSRASIFHLRRLGTVSEVPEISSPFSCPDACWASSALTKLNIW